MSSARSLAFALLAGACADHVTIGGIDPGVDATAANDASSAPRMDADAAKVDANFDLALDARVVLAPDSGSTPVDAATGGPLSVTLRVFGHDYLTSLTVSCGAPCVDLEAVARGGTPPLQFSWGDGQSGNPAKLCPSTKVLVPAPGAPYAIVRVTDSSQPAPQIFDVWPGIGLTTPGVDCADAGAPHWQVCVSPPAERTCTGDAAGLWYDLDAPWSESHSSARFEFLATALAPLTVDIYAASARCEGLVRIGGGTVQEAAPTMEVALDGLNPPARYLVLRVQGAADGAPPVDVSVDFHACFDR